MTSTTDTTTPTSAATVDAAVEPGVDGRRARRDRNRDKVVDALLELYDEGNLRPAVAEVADRSGVSHRSVFRYFEDLEELYRIAIQKNLARLEPLIGLQTLGVGTLEERIEAIVQQRLALHRRQKATSRVARMLAYEQPVLEQVLANSAKKFRRQVERHFEQELDAMDAAKRVQTLAAADIICAFDAYDMMSRVRELDDETVAAVMRNALAALFA